MSQTISNFFEDSAKSQVLASSQLSPVSIVDGEQLQDASRCTASLDVSSPSDGFYLPPVDDSLLAVVCNEESRKQLEDFLDGTLNINNNTNELEKSLVDATTNKEDFNILDHVSNDVGESTHNNSNNNQDSNASNIVDVSTISIRYEPDLSESERESEASNDGVIDDNNNNNNNINLPLKLVAATETNNNNEKIDFQLSDVEEGEPNNNNNNNNNNNKNNNKNNNQAQQITTSNPIVATTANPNTSYIPELYDEERDDPSFNNNNNINKKIINKINKKINNSKRLIDQGPLKRTSRPRLSYGNKQSKGGRGYEKVKMLCAGDPVKSLKWFEITLIPIENDGESMMRNIRPLYQRLAFILPDSSFVITCELVVPGFDDGEPVVAEDDVKPSPDEKKVLFKLDPKLRYSYDILMRFNVEKMHANVLRQLMTRFLGLEGHDKYVAKCPNGNRQKCGNGNLRVQITGCSQGKNAIQNYTSELTAFIYGINQREVNPHWRVAQYAKIRKTLSDTNTLLLRNRRDARSLRETFELVRDMLTVKPTLKLFEHPKFGDWRDAVVEWWNTMVTEGKFDRFCQIYLWGPSSTGKTTLINQILNNSEVTEEFRYIIPNQKSGEERFIIASYKKERYVVAFWDENRIWKSVECLKKVLAGEPVSTEIKGHIDKKIIFDIPIIMVSNVSFEKFIKRLPDCDKDALRKRVVVVEANGRTYEDERNKKLRERIEEANYQNTDYLPAEIDLAGEDEQANNISEEDDDESESSSDDGL